MKKKISEIFVGDILLEDVVNINGTIILNKNEAITQNHLLILKMWGVKQLDIKTSFVENDEQKFEKKRSIAGINEITDKILMIADEIKSKRVDFL